MTRLWWVVLVIGCAGRQGATTTGTTAAVTRVPGMSLPESVLWDEQADVYLVSNINGEPFAADDDGFIARVSPDGEKVDRLIDGADPAVTLHSPRGLAVSGDRLFVADLTAVRVFDRTTGKPLGVIEVPGAVMLNDLAVRGDRVLASDSGLPAAKQPPSASHGVYEIDPASGTVTPLAVAPDLGRPNGLAVIDGQIWVATYGSGELYRLCDGAPCDREKLPGGGLDGIVVDGDELYVSSWEKEAIYVGAPGKGWMPVVEKVAACADIGWDGKRRRLLLPLLEAGVLEIRSVP
jgi:sugar lactone lactonase YvrE